MTSLTYLAKSLAIAIATSNLILTGSLILAIAKPNPLSEVRQQARKILPFDSDWRFLKADASGAEKPDFDDSSWRKLNVPHDWSIEGPLSKDNPTGKGGGFLPAGVGWYRKHFVLPLTYKGRKVFVEFDGVMENSDVWVNGAHLMN